MTYRRLGAIVLLLTLTLVSSPTPAQGVPGIDFRRFLPPPPPGGSLAAVAELVEEHRIVDTATPTRMAQARWDAAHENPSAFYATVGPGFDLDTLPATRAVVAIALRDSERAANAAKAAFARRRPWAVDPTIATCTPTDKPQVSYPSGHATLGYTVAMTLAALIPEKSQALLARAADYALSRSVCGSHFPSDTAAGEVLAAAAVASLAQDPRYLAAMARAHAELAAAGFAKP